MDKGNHAQPRASAGPRRSWRVGTPAVVVACGVLFAASAVHSEGTDLRPGRYLDLASLVSDQRHDVERLTARAGDLSDQVTTLSNVVGDRGAKRFNREIRRWSDPAGLTAYAGPGITITLSDAPEDVINSTTQNINLLIVHQQDIQAVINALWGAGATAVTVQGQRIVSTTGITCEGNAVQLQGVPYAQPYVIQAVGDQASLLAGVDADDYLTLYREQALLPDVAVGWDLQLSDHVVAPAYDGVLTTTYARPLS